MYQALEALIIAMGIASALAVLVGVLSARNKDKRHDGW